MTQPSTSASLDRCDEVVVGAGIAGLATALLLARRGRSVIVLEARAVGDGTTARSTGKVSALQGARLGEVADRNLAPIVAAYAASQVAAVDWVREFVAAAEVPVVPTDAVTFAVGDRGAELVRRELDLGREHGLPLERVADPGLPFRTSAAIRLADQLALDPRELLAALAAAVRREGGTIHEHRPVTGVRAGDPAVVRTAAGDLAAEHVIIATGAPILDRGLYFAKTSPQRSYLMVSTVPPGSVPDAMLLGVDSPLRSIRDGGGLLVTGGAGHGVGRAPAGAAAERLRAATLAAWPAAEEQDLWSAQDLETPHRVPFVGWLPRGRGRIFLATGFGKWGLTNGVAAAMTIVADLLGGGTDWQRALHRRVTLPQAIAAGIAWNAATAAWYAKGWLGALAEPLGDRVPPDGGGIVGRRGVIPTGRAVVDGELHEVCAVCPHLGAVLTWNDLERSWDCPAHGSRFEPTGEVLDGPATRGLAAPPSGPGATPPA